MGRPRVLVEWQTETAYCFPDMGLRPRTKGDEDIMDRKAARALERAGSVVILGNPEHAKRIIVSDD